MEHGLFTGAGTAISGMIGNFLWSIIIFIGPIYGIYQIIFGKILHKRLIGLAILGSIAAIELQLYHREDAYAAQIKARAQSIAELPRLTDRSNLPNTLVVESDEYRGSELDRQAVALAESGAFDVWIAPQGMLRGPPPYDIKRLSRPGFRLRHVQVGAFDDCASYERHSIEFWALSGLTRCGREIDADALPARFLRFRAPQHGEGPLALVAKDAGASNTASGVVIFKRSELSLVDGPKITLIDYAESWCQPFFSNVSDKFYFGISYARPGDLMLPDGLMQYSGATRDPIGFILAATGKSVDPPQHVADPSPEADELAKQIEGLLAQATPYEKWPVEAAAWLLWSRLPRDGARTRALAERLVAIDTGLPSVTQYIEPWECPSFDGLLEKRDLLVDVCTQAAKNLVGDTHGLSCHLPVTEAYALKCRPPRGGLWTGGDVKGRKVILIGQAEAAKRTDAAISYWSGKADDPVLFPSLQEIFVPETAGKLDILIRGRGVWVFTGSTNCVARVTIVSQNYIGISGIAPSLVETRYVWEVPNSPRVRFAGTPDLVAENAAASSKQLEGVAPAGSCGAPASPLPQFAPPDSGEGSAAQSVVHIDAKSLVTSPDNVPFNVPMIAVSPQPSPAHPPLGVGSKGRMDL